MEVLCLSPLCNENPVQVAESQKSAEELYLERLFAGTEMGRVAKGEYPQEPESAS